jgi:Galactose oxidase-like, Early set domain
MGQRHVWLRVNGQKDIAGGRALDLFAPSSGAVAPAGDYLLFVVDRYGVPSRGRFVRFGA